MGMMTFPRSPVAASEAREFVSAALGKHPALDDALLVTSELVTNSVMHASDAASVGVSVCFGGACVRIDVWDDGCAGIPHIRDSVDGDAEGGRGLQLVNLIAWQWGFSRSPGRSCCWAEIAASAEVFEEAVA